MDLLENKNISKLKKNNDNELIFLLMKSNFLAVISKQLIFLDDNKNISELKNK